MAFAANSSEQVVEELLGIVVVLNIVNLGLFASFFFLNKKVSLCFETFFMLLFDS